MQFAAIFTRYPLTSVKKAPLVRSLPYRGIAPRGVLLFLFIALVIGVSTSCSRGPGGSGEVMYVSAPQANLRDRVAAVYNKIGTVKNGDRVEVLDRQKRFLRVRTENGMEGWIEQRNLVKEEVFTEFEQLRKEHEKTPVQGRGLARRALNLHVTPERESEHLYQMKEEEKLEILKRTASPKAPKAKSRPLPQSNRPTATPAATVQAPVAAKPAATPSPVDPPVMEDWYLIRDSGGHVGWVLAQMVDVDVPLEVAQYSEGHRIMAAFVLNQVQDDDRVVPQYLLVVSDPKPGQPYDFNQFRVFTWNTKRDRYETAYRERNIFGVFPVSTATEDFGKEGVQPVFTILAKDEAGQNVARKYRLIGPIVRRIPAPGETTQNAPKLVRPDSSGKRSGRK